MNTILKTSLTLVMIGGLFACGGADKPTQPPGASVGGQATDASTPAQSTKADGLITAADLQLGDVDATMAERGKTTYDVKCQACHSTGANRVVGPGWKGLTTKREPAWIMNMIMNIDVMLEKDPEAQKLLEECLVRMPNQNLSKDESREVLEFMRTL